VSECPDCHDSGIVVKDGPAGRWAECCSCEIGQALKVQLQETVRDLAAGR
jgi:hypothetical protein